MTHKDSLTRVNRLLLQMGYRIDFAASKGYDVRTKTTSYAVWTPDRKLVTMTAHEIKRLLGY